MIQENLSIDFQKFNEALEYCIKNPTSEVDTLTAAVRRATGILDLDLTPEQRSQAKMAAHGQLYGMGWTRFCNSMHNLPKL